MSDFVHLHNHTDYSLLDAAQTVEVMCNRVYDLGMDSIAVTDHGNLFAMLPFYNAAKKAGIKPILGCEIYVAVNSHTEKKQVTTLNGKKWGYHHLVLLAQNLEGYHNLMKLCSIGFLEGFYYRPRVDKELLKKYNAGLIATSGCLAGEITAHAAAGDYENAKNAALEYAEIFPNRFYLELQNHDIPEEKKAHVILKKLASELNLPLVATNDCHYCYKQDSDAHDVLFCLGTGKDKADPNRLRYEPGKFYVKSADEMYKIFKDVPESLENTVKIASQCDVELPLGQYHLPAYPVPENTSPDGFLKEICISGLKERYSEITPNMNQRLNYELDVIKNMGYAGYFLITQDFVNYAKTNKIPVGPGRGSAAGSLVAYATGITNIDPLKYNLLFERFLNSERVTMPDIDIDFCIEGRDKVIDYIKDKYGHDSVAQIITFGTMKAKSVIRDVGRVLGMNYGEVDSIAKLIPNEPKITIDKAMKLNPEFRQIKDKSLSHEELINYSKTLEGCHRHASTHAAGVVVTPGPLTNYVPLFKNSSTGDVATQVDMNGLEELGLLKMDFLGLRNLTVIDKALQIINSRHNLNINIDEIDLTDIEVYNNIFSTGNTIGIFQFESDGMRDYLSQLKPTSIDDLISMTSLYRPGPMASIPEFIARKKGESKIQYLHPLLEPILNETYGIIVYQEQVMEISSTVGGFSLAESDIMRRAMGKKKKNLMASYKIKFVDGAKEKGVNKKTAIEIFELLEKFAEYGFNKSHAAAYSVISYQTAWLKNYYPTEFMAANISSDINDTNKVVKLISDAKKMDIKIMPPDINTSSADFVINEDKVIQYGLAAIKNVGYKVAELIANERKENGPYKSIFDLCTINSNLINKKAIESLILVGACNSLSEHQAQLHNSIDTIIEFTSKFHRNMNSNQESLFGSDQLSAIAYPTLDNVEEWSQDIKIKHEKELLGFYLTYNPLEKFSDDLNELSTIDNRGFNTQKSEFIQLGGLVNDINLRYDKNNNQWAILMLDTNFGSLQVYVFYATYAKYLNEIKLDAPIFIKGKISAQTDENFITQIIANKIYPLYDIKKRIIKNINIAIKYTNKDQTLLDQLEKICLDNSGPCNIMLHLFSSQNRQQKVLINKYKTNPSSEVLQLLRDIFGVKNVWLS